MRRTLVLAVLFLGHALPFLNRPALIAGDELHYALMAHSMAVDGDLELTNNYVEVEHGSNAAGWKQAGDKLEPHERVCEGRRCFAHPLGLPALTAPALAVLQRVHPGAAPDVLLVSVGLVLTYLALLAGWRLLADLTGSKLEGCLLAFAIYFATPLWFYSRLFHTEAYAWSIAVLAIYALTRRRSAIASALLGVLFLLKEPFVILVLPLLVGVWLRLGFRRAAAVAIGPLLGFGLWVLKNVAVHGEPLATFQSFHAGDPVTGAVGLLIDPRHGLLPFAPVIVLSLLPWRAPGRNRTTDLEVLAWATFLIGFGLTSCWRCWWGGDCYGPRLLTPFIPTVALSLVAVWLRARTHVLGRTLFVVLIAAGFMIQFLAACRPFSAYLNVHIADLLTRNPLRTVLAFLVGLVAATLLVRWIRQSQRTVHPPRLDGAPASRA